MITINTQAQTRSMSWRRHLDMLPNDVRELIELQVFKQHKRIARLIRKAELRACIKMVTREYEVFTPSTVSRYYLPFWRAMRLWRASPWSAEYDGPVYCAAKHGVTPEDIDRLEAVITKRFERYRQDNQSHGMYDFYTPYVISGKVLFRFNIVVHHDGDRIVQTFLRFEIEDDGYSHMNTASDCGVIDQGYSRSKTIREALVKFIEGKYVYLKAHNKITTLEDYEEQEIVDKICKDPSVVCSVCQDWISPRLTTPCDHFLCLECYLSLKKRTCPICRRCLNPDCEDCDDSDDSDE